MAYIGISFGNTTSSIAAQSKDGNGVEVIANPDGERAIPSSLAYIGDDEYHGGQALAHLIRNPKNTIINFRDYLGQSFDKVDPTITERAAHATDLNGQIGFKYTIEETTKEITALEASTRHLEKLKDAAEDYLGKNIEGAVVAVPTNFTDVQKAELLKASEAAGLKVLQFINEPSAALLAHTSVDNRLEQDKTYVVADFGGVRSDAAVISVRGGILTILATAHDYELGGDKLDDALSEFIAKEFEKKYKVDPRKTARSLAKLKDAAILAKKTLSNVQTATISIESLADGIDYHSTINRLRYELVSRNVLNQFTSFVESVVKKANLDVLDIDEVLLAGGVSNTPKLASNVQAIFEESTVVVAPSLDSKVSNPEELVARGAALQASLLENIDAEEIKESLSPVIINTQHLSKAIGILDAEGNFYTILKAESTYPVRRSVQLDAPKGDVLITVVEGEDKIKETTLEPAAKDEDDEDNYSDEEPEIVREKHIVAGAKLAELAVRGNESDKIEVIFNITKDGSFSVTAREAKQGSTAFKGEIPN